MSGSTALRDARADIVRGTLAAGAVGLFVNLLHLMGPLYLIQVYDRVITSQSLETLAALSLLAAAILVFQGCLDFLKYRVFMVLGERLAVRLGAETFRASVKASLKHPGRDAGSAMRDLSELRGFISGGTVGLPIDLSMAPFFLAVLFLLHPMYGLVGSFAAVALTVVAVAVEMVARRPMTNVSERVQSVQSDTAAAIRHADVIDAMGMLESITRRWHDKQAKALADLGDGQTRARALTVAAKSLRTGLQLLIIATGAILVIDGQVSAGTLIASSVIMGRALLPFEQLIEGWRQWSEAIGATKRLSGMLNEAGERQGAAAVPIESGRTVADRVWLVPQGRKRPVVRNVSFAVEDGELLGIVGPSGAGKSSLARLVVGIGTSTNGAIYLDGHNVAAEDRRSLGGAVGYLPQDPSLLRATVAENIARMDIPDMAAVIAAARTAGVHELIGTLPRGYETVVGDGDLLLSGGQRQRLAFARALYGTPRLLVLDEPNSSLDAEGEAALIEAVETARGWGASVIIVAQRMSILSRATKLLVLQEGVVAHYGERDTVLEALAKRDRTEEPREVTALPLRRQKAG